MWIINSIAALDFLARVVSHVNFDGLGESQLPATTTSPPTSPTHNQIASSNASATANSSSKSSVPSVVCRLVKAIILFGLNPPADFLLRKASAYALHLEWWVFFENSNLIHILLLIVEHSHVSIGITRAPSHTRLSASIRIYILTWASLRTNCLRDQIQRNFLLEPNLLSFFFWFLLISPCMYKFFRLCSSLLRFYLNFIYRMS